MKSILYIMFGVLCFFSCSTDSEYVTFSGKITNSKSDSLIIFHPKRSFRKVIRLNENGSFKDSLKVLNGLFSITNTRNFALLYLKNGDHVTMNFDENKFEKTINFKNDLALENNFLAKSMANENSFFSNRDLMFTTKSNFEKKVNTYIDNFNNRLNETKLEEDFVSLQKEQIGSFRNYIEKDYLEKNYKSLVLGKGKVSPKFFNYENYKGGVLSLDDLKGKYVYMDIWATWCPPCKAEIPHLKKIEAEFHDKNIAFVSISLDNKRDYKNWKSMVTNKKLGGIQLYAKEDTDFTTAYRVKSIPRFILIDPKGNIIDADAPRPSEARLKGVLESLNL